MIKEFEIKRKVSFSLVVFGDSVEPDVSLRTCCHKSTLEIVIESEINCFVCFRINFTQDE